MAGYCGYDGVGLDEACNSTGCRWPLSCDRGTCSTLRSANQTCSSSLKCDLGLSCVAGSCVKDFSAAAGSPCSARSCAPPLVCSNDGQCISATSPSWQLKRCTSDSQCPTDSFCACDWTEGKRRCTVKGSPSWSSLVVQREMVACIKSHGYDRRPCYDKVLAWLQTRWDASRVAPVPELYCLVSSDSTRLTAMATAMLILFVGLLS
jgi:hypothetical protein